MSEWKNICEMEKIIPGDCEMADLEDTEIVICNLGGEFYAIEDTCTHDGGYLTGGIVEYGEITCPRHSARFSVKNGKCLTPHAYDPITTYPVRIKDGMIQVMNEQENWAQHYQRNRR